MYSIRLGYDNAIKRINKLAKNGHHSESLVTSVFTCEKTIRRTLKQLIVSSGFKSKIANQIIKNKGFNQLKDSWEIFDPKHRKFSEIISQDDLRIINEAVKMRNKLVHGQQVFNIDQCKEETTKTLTALNNIKKTFDDLYGFSGWDKVSVRRKSVLHSDPKIKIKGLE